MGSESNAVLFYILHLLNIKSETSFCFYKYLSGKKKEVLGFLLAAECLCYLIFSCSKPCSVALSNTYSIIRTEINPNNYLQNAENLIIHGQPNTLQ
jgi:hypothetical protein